MRERSRSPIRSVLRKDSGLRIQRAQAHGASSGQHCLYLPPVQESRTRSGRPAGRCAAPVRESSRRHGILHSRVTDYEFANPVTRREITWACVSKQKGSYRKMDEARVLSWRHPSRIIPCGGRKAGSEFRAGPGGCAGVRPPIVRGTESRPVLYRVSPQSAVAGARPRW